MNILDDYMKIITASECPKDFLRWAFISAMSANLARRVYFKFGRNFIYPNLFVFLVGESASKKSEAISLARSVLKDANFTHFSANKTSGNKLIEDWARGSKETTMAQAFADEETGAGSQLYVMEGEMLNFLGESNKELLTTLTNLYDSPDEYGISFKGFQGVIYQPIVGMLGGFTHMGLHAALPYEASTSGFLSRTMLVYCDPVEHKIAWPEELASEDFALIVSGLKRLKDLCGEVTFDAEAKLVSTEIYQNWKGLDDAKLVSYNGRRYIMLLKLSMILAIAEFKMQVSKDNVIHANTIMTFTESKMSLALSEFGASKFSSAVQQILRALKRKPQGVVMDDLYRLVHADLDRYSQFTDLISSLAKAKKLITSPTSTLVLPVLNVVDHNAPYTDFARYIDEYKKPQSFEESEFDKELKRELSLMGFDS